MNQTLTDILPTSFPVQNTHRHVVFRAEAEPDEFARVEMMTADAIKHARTALKIGKKISDTEGRAFRYAVDNLGNYVVKGRVLGNGFREDVSELLIHMDQAAGAPDQLMSDMSAALGLAMALSQRVADLLAAERDVGWHRGIRAD